jgi:hypothetical protein
MIVDDYKTIADNHDRLFQEGTLPVVAAERTDDDAWATLLNICGVEFTEEDIRDLLAACRSNYLRLTIEQATL